MLLLFYYLELRFIRLELNVCVHRYILKMFPLSVNGQIILSVNSYIYMSHGSRTLTTFCKKTGKHLIYVFV